MISIAGKHSAKALQLLPKTRDERKEIIRHKSITFFRKPKTAKGARFGCEVMRTIIHGFQLISDATSKFVLLGSKDGRESTTQNTRTTPTSKAKHFYATELSACAFSMDSLGNETKIPLLILISRNFLLFHCLTVFRIHSKVIGDLSQHSSGESNLNCVRASERTQKIILGNLLSFSQRK